jgi:uncharacterized membrane protein HdeD (DUF308 family)
MVPHPFAQLRAKGWGTGHERVDVNRVRGIVMLLAGCFALFEAWRMLTGSRALLALILGLVAIALGVWHLTRKPPKRLV